MRVIIKKSMLYLLIILFFVLGIIGLALPLVPQIFFFAICLILISFEVPWIEHKVEKFLKKYPEALRIYLKHKNFLEKLFK